jgi:hypothetical protein
MRTRARSHAPVQNTSGPKLPTVWGPTPVNTRRNILITPPGLLSEARTSSKVCSPNMRAAVPRSRDSVASAVDVASPCDCRAMTSLGRTSSNKSDVLIKRAVQGKCERAQHKQDQQMPTHSHPRTHVRTHARTHALTHAHTHTHTHTRLKIRDDSWTSLTRTQTCPIACDACKESIVLPGCG